MLQKVRRKKRFTEIEEEIKEFFTFPEKDPDGGTTSYTVDNPNITNILLWEILKEIKHWKIFLYGHSRSSVDFQ